jgi:TPR repeat protein
MYLSGEGLEKSLPLAEKWLSRAAALGHEKAAEKAAEAF